MRIFGLIITLLAISLQSLPAQDAYVLMISFDGFRYDYPEQHNLPAFDSIAANGACAERMIPCFPSKTFPNHYTLVTGMYPGNHGLIDNKFFDPSLDLLYSGKSKTLNDPRFYGGWPLWQWVQQHGMRSASFFWIGSEAEIHGSYPDFWKKYEHNYPNDARIDTVFHWLSLPENERPHFVSLYFSILDDAGHNFGPDSRNVAEALVEADRLISVVRKKIRESGLPVNLVVVSDHGMFEIDAESGYLIDLLNYVEIPRDAIRIVNSGSHLHIYLNDKDFGPVLYDALKNHPDDLSIYKREELPESWHYGDSDRIGDYLIVAPPGYYFSKEKSGIFGVHGYDPDAVEDMGAIFYAEGPGIQQGVHLAPFRNIDVYSFICALLGIEAADNDGNLDILGEALKSGN